MNAAQSKQLIEAARKAAWSLHPDSVEARELWSAIHRAETVSKPANREKCCFCEEAGAELGGFSKKLKLRMAHVVCAEAFYQRKAEFQAWCSSDYGLDNPRWEGTVYKAAIAFDKAAECERLSYCACGHRAESHREDRDGNLLECSALVGERGTGIATQCECNHFHYHIESAEAA